MARIVVFGAGGRVGRAAVAEAVRRGHAVTAVVRDPDRHPELAAAAGSPGPPPTPCSTTPVATCSR
ncbi:NAD(P)H-binding protein, partial [Kitasatospora cineracea]